MKVADKTKEAASWVSGKAKEAGTWIGDTLKNAWDNIFLRSAVMKNELPYEERPREISAKNVIKEILKEMNFAGEWYEKSSFN